ncbi:hypothetical protein [Palaeococcus sp. (in: euryarchaeotes)]
MRVKALTEKGISISHHEVLGHYGIRVSPCLHNTKEEVELFLEALGGLKAI